MTIIRVDHWLVNKTGYIVFILVFHLKLSFIWKWSFKNESNPRSFPMANYPHSKNENKFKTIKRKPKTLKKKIKNSQTNTIFPFDFIISTIQRKEKQMTPQFLRVSILHPHHIIHQLTDENKMYGISGYIATTTTDPSILWNRLLSINFKSRVKI